MGDYSPSPDPYGLVAPDGADPIRNGDNRLRALVDQLSGVLPLYAPLAVVDTLPVSPVDGQVVYFQNAAMAALQTIWPLRFDESEEEWIGLGGSPLMQLNNGAAAAIAATSTNVTGSPSPTLVVPLSGTYLVSFGAFLSVSGTGDIIQLSCTVFEDATSRESDGGSVFFVGESASAAGVNLSRETRMTLTAGSTLGLRYTNATSLPMSAQAQRLSIAPLSVPG